MKVMSRARLGPIVLAAALGGATLTLSACAGRAQFPTGPVPDVVSTGAATDHVIVISVDGLRPDAIARFDTPTFRRLMAEGSHSLSATTIMPSHTLPSHTSMLTGTDPEAHGVTWNNERLNEHGHVATPTIFAAADQAGLRTAAFFSKSKFRHLEVPGTLDYSQAPGAWPGIWSADRTTDDVARYLQVARPNLLFVHIAEPDVAGHLFGWMKTFYGWAVEEADEEVGQLLEAADKAFGRGDYTVLLTADHGGHGRFHGSDDPRDVTIPWVAWGEGVASGRVLPDGIRTMDTAATVLWLLGLAAEHGTVGQVVEAAFSPSAPSDRAAP